MHFFSSFISKDKFIFNLFNFSQFLTSSVKLQISILIKSKLLFQDAVYRRIERSKNLSVSSTRTVITTPMMKSCASTDSTSLHPSHYRFARNTGFLRYSGGYGFWLIPKQVVSHKFVQNWQFSVVIRGF